MKVTVRYHILRRENDVRIATLENPPQDWVPPAGAVVDSIFMESEPQRLNKPATDAEIGGKLRELLSLYSALD